jgi:hypothetical protein
MKTVKLTQAEKLAFYKENGYWFGETPKKTILPNTKEINRAEVFKKEETEWMTAEEKVEIEESNIERRKQAIKNNL